MAAKQKPKPAEAKHKPTAADFPGKRLPRETDDRSAERLARRRGKGS